jgi:O-antigen ligase
MQATANNKRHPSDRPLVLSCFLIVSVFLFGLYPYWCALFAGAFLALLLCLAVKKGQPIVFPLSLPSLALCAAVLFYLLSVCWAIDKGMALLGFLKYLPAPLFIALTATVNADREWLLRSLARAGGFSALVCLALCTAPDMRGLFFPNGRFSGPFLYANSYGLFLLACIVILCRKEVISPASTKKSALLSYADYVLIAISSLGVFLTGSRSLMLLFVPVFVFLILNNRRMALACAMGAISAALLSFFTGLTGALQRSADISLTSGEWLSRLAYYQDGLRLVWENPFGLGHLGWWYVQPAIQTAVYDVRLIHNWLLQSALDIGVIPALLLMAAALALFFHKGHGIRERLLIALILGHALIDFDLAYLPFVFIIALLLTAGPTVKLAASKKRAFVPLALCSLMMLLSLWLGTASLISYTGRDKAAAALYPIYTEAMEKAIATEPDPGQAFILADKLLSHNKYVFDAYDVKGKIYADKKLWKDAVEMKQRYVSISRLQGPDYDELLMYIHFAIQQAAQEGDVDSCRYLADLALSIPDTLSDLEASLNVLAYRLNHKPTLTLSEVSKRFLVYIKEFRTQL